MGRLRLKSAAVRRSRSKSGPRAPGERADVGDSQAADEKRLEIALATRAFEINLFWKRSIFFWGFISVAFVGYAALRNERSQLAIVVACFGMVCSSAWTLLNRGSKYWQENWETKVERYEDNVTGPLFAVQETVQRKGRWLQARRYSVSKLLIALSDYVLIMWSALAVWESYRFIRQFECSVKDIGIAVFCVFSFAYVVLLLFVGRTTRSQPADGDDAEV
ncbi:MAG TPA: hypothetical protein VFB25_11195 [Gaiellaceae bacterium]|nr:hypothetical protein [Gaiellaceae bacterium]